ncbi:MAG: hypothetical protein LBI42_04160 [Chitinispirillales bacterium]|jgi:hypothetical protein|nr:hypothetical protein [Chitinispirillales bacterium]
MESVKIPGIIRFRDYIKKLPHQWILDNLICNADKSRRILSSAMIEETVSKFVSKQSLAERFEGLPQEFKLKCAQVYLMGANGLGVACQDDFVNDTLLNSLLVFAAVDRGITRYFGFDEFEPHLRSLMAQALCEAGRGSRTAAKQQAAVYPWRPLNDVAAVCSMAFQKLLKRSRFGGISRSGLSQLKRLVHDSTLTGKGGDRDAGGHPSGFLIGYCLRNKLIAPAESEYILDQRRFDTWLKTGVKERLLEFIEYASVFCGRFGFELLTGVLDKCEGKWFTVKNMVPEPDREIFLQALKVYDFLGFLAVENLSGEARFTQLRNVNGDPDRLLSNQEAVPMIIMPDFSVIIPQEVSPPELFSYANIGILKSFDKVYKGQINRQSVSNAMSQGVDDTDIRLWLLKRNSPANVLSTVEEWAREFSRLYVCHGAILVSSTEKVTLQLCAYEHLKKYLTPVDNHAVFRILPEGEQEVLETLEKLGFDPRASDEHPAVTSCEDKCVETLAEKSWEAVTDFSCASAFERAVPMRGTKYGEQLKELDINEMSHVVDYAILTGQRIIIDYEGSAFIKQNTYTVLPLALQKGPDPVIEAEVSRTKARKQFFLRKVRRIGVVSQ